MVLLSTGTVVPEIKELSRHQLLSLILIPIEDGSRFPFRKMPDDLINYLKEAEKEFFKKTERRKKNVSK